MSKTEKTSTQCAYEILLREKRPMRCQELIEVARREFGLILKGKTPAATLNSNFINEIKRRRKSGREQRFVRVGPGLWGLREYLGTHYSESS